MQGILDVHLPASILKAFTRFINIIKILRNRYAICFLHTFLSKLEKQAAESILGLKKNEFSVFLKDVK